MYLFLEQLLNEFIIKHHLLILFQITPYTPCVYIVIHAASPVIDLN